MGECSLPHEQSERLETSIAEGKVFYESKRLEIGKMIRELCKWKEVNLIEGEVCLDHVHILVEIPPKLSVSSFMGFLKGKTSIMIYQKYGNMKHEAKPKQACLISVACRLAKCERAKRRQI